MEFKLQSLS